MQCPRCQHQNSPDHKFCSECGTALKRASGKVQPTPSYTDLQHSLTEAFEQQSAMAEILRIISTSPTNLQPVLDEVVKSAARFCAAPDASIFRLDGGNLRAEAHHGAVSQPAGFLIPLVRGTVAGRSVLERQTIAVTDLQVETDEYPEGSALARQTGQRATLSAPLLREGTPIGVILLRRGDAVSFTGTQIALLKTFANQAVIAIENVRLFTELQERNKALTQAHAQVSEALEQQTATSEILKVISGSPTDVRPVFDAIIQNAVRLCGGFNGTVFRFDGSLIHVAAHHNFAPEAADVVHRVFPIPPDRGSVTGRAILTRSVIHLPDLASDAEHTRPKLLEAGFRAILAVPMLRDGAPIGAITVTRREPEPFSEGEISLLQTFADQAVIAIENVRLFNETKEALDRQTATSEILRVISQSPTDVQPVFDAIAESAVRLCDAVFGGIFRVDGETLRAVGRHGPIAVRGFVMPIKRGTVAGRTVLERRTVHVIDLQAEEEEFPEGSAIAKELGHRTTLGVPLLREGAALGAVVIRRAEAEPFTEKQIALLETFADQAVIAIENVRLFTETKEALEQQTATSEILRVIGSSPTDAQPVFETIARSGVSVCAALGCAVFVVDGDMVRVAATHGVRPERIERFRQEYPAPLDAKIDTAQTIRGRRVFHLADIEHNPNASASDIENARLAGYQTRLMVPMVRGDRALGLIAVTREAPTPFSAQQVDLLKTFADQAVIAIENVRLFRELETRNRDLTEALDQQTATSEVLKVISRSTFDLQPVLEILIENATRLCGAQQGFLFTSDGELHHLAVEYNAPPAFKEWVLTHPSRTGDASVVGRVAREGCVIQILDAQADAAWRARNVGAPGLSGVRSLLGVPMRREGVLIGVIAMWRTAVRPYTNKEQQLVETFADQAVIAIENVRLVTELQARTQDLTRSVEQLTALGEVGRAVSSTLDLETVLSTIVSRAVQLSGLDGGVVFEYDEPTEEFVQRVATETGGTLAEVRRTTRFRKGEGVLGRTAITLEPAQVPDITVPGAYESRLRENLIASGIRAILAVPMVREDRLIGCLAVTRNHSGEFAAETIELMRTFATQSALAIQNARLFREIEDKSRQLEVASQHKSEFLANMSHELRTPLNAIIGFSEVLADRMFGDLNEKQEEYLKDIYASGTHLLSLINDILDLSKIEAGRMELELADFDLPQAIDNALMLVRERAGRRSITLHTAVDARLGQVRADERKVRQVVLNLLSNAIKFTPEGGRIEVAASPRDGSVEVSVSDTGVGIAPEDHEAVFEEFRQVGTVEKKAEGTGLGLTLCRKFVELHGGKIWVKSELGVGSTFTFTIPVRRGA